jgi:hypothetical protein
MTWTPPLPNTTIAPPADAPKPEKDNNGLKPALEAKAAIMEPEAKEQKPKASHSLPAHHAVKHSAEAHKKKR